MVNLKVLVEAFKSLARCVTIKYPFGPPAYLPEGLRGKPEFDREKCVGCGGCFNCCPPEAITIVEENGKRKIEVNLGKCLYCATCQEVCPEDAIMLTSKFELAVYDLNQAKEVVEVNQAVCENCGRYFAPEPQILKVRDRGLSKINVSQKETIEKDFQVYSKYCSTCRKQLSFRLNYHPRKYY
ncbi:MAG: 4Fe-4S dicluster domain-containing protein [Candidatus Bathyarchaeota archaeon]